MIRHMTSTLISPVLISGNHLKSFLGKRGDLSHKSSFEHLICGVWSPRGGMRLLIWTHMYRTAREIILELERSQCVKAQRLCVTVRSLFVNIYICDSSSMQRVRIHFILQIHLGTCFRKSVRTAGSLWATWINIFTYIRNKTLFFRKKPNFSNFVINSGTLQDLLQLQSSDSVLWIVKKNKKKKKPAWSILKKQKKTKNKQKNAFEFQFKHLTQFSCASSALRSAPSIKLPTGLFWLVLSRVNAEASSHAHSDALTSRVSPSALI